MLRAKSVQARACAAIGAVVIGLGIGLAATGPASAGHRGHFNSQIDDPSVRPLQDWEVFGFDISSVPDDSASLAAFRASLDPRTRLGIANRCRDDIAIYPNRYSPKIRTFCFGS